MILQTFFTYISHFLLLVDSSSVKQVHIAQGFRPDIMTISWVTKNPEQTTVKYGFEKDNLNMTATGNYSSYYFDYPEYGVYQSGTIHHVQLTDLLASIRYHYKCGNFETNDVSETFHFYTTSHVGSITQTIFAVLGDLGQTDNSKDTINHIKSNDKIEMILHPGDLSYADCKQDLWDSYGELIEPLAARVPWMVGPGNHELELTKDQQFYRAFEERYKMPQIREPQFGPIIIPPKYHDDDFHLPYCCSSIFQSIYDYGNSFYSFESASAHIVFLNPYTLTNETSEQYMWLKTDLEKVNRRITPWIIVVMHCPWYSSNQDHYEEQQTVIMREMMEPMFHKYRVNIAFTGHVHAYERTYPLYKNKTDDYGTVYITVGDGGNLEGHSKAYYEMPEWSAYRNGTQYGYGLITLLNPRRLQWSWYRNKDEEYVYSDSVTICNSYYSKAYC